MAGGNAEDEPAPRTPSPRGAAGAAAGLLLSGARLTDGREVDVRIAQGRIQAVGTARSLSAREETGGPGAAGAAAGLGAESAEAVGGGGYERVDLRGYLLLPAPVEAHSHLEAAFGAEAGGDLCGGTGDAGPAGPEARAREMRETQRRLVEGALTTLGYGAAEQRTHVGIGGLGGLSGFEAAMAAGEALRGLVELQTVACPRLLTGRAGADGRAQLREAVKAGAYAVGGCPELDPDPAGFVDELAAVAAEFGCAVDLHTDGADPVRLARTAVALGPLRPRVAVGPLGRLARTGREAREAPGGMPLAAAQLGAHGVAVVWLPQGGSCVGDRGPGGGTGRTGRRAEAAAGWSASGVRMLADAGVRVAAGSGGLRDAANPVGSADPLRSAFALAAGGGLAPEAAYAAVSGAARRLLGLDEVLVEAGYPAELLAVRGESLAEALSAGHSRVVVHGGRVVSRTSAVREFADPGPGPDTGPGRGSDGRPGGAGAGSSAVPRQGGAR
ncbi:amidohydrolase family protein [Phaeacidiphilus oryzae]|uniref:hypothetical protein n=1 Tax=Phaeacidiphilus oryzae TaxID=348818 RepID=UPI00068A6434|nr:hypothetical protein [Phaeacidiphilus oryzae]